jgi:hypothetical protein
MRFVSPKRREVPESLESAAAVSSTLIAVQLSSKAAATRQCDYFSSRTRSPKGRLSFLSTLALGAVSCAPKVTPVIDPGRPAQPVSISISGTVRLGAAPLKGANIAIGDTILRLVTDDEGRFRADTSLPNDCYELRAYGIGFVPIVTTLRVEGPGNYTVGTLWIQGDTGPLRVDTIPGPCLLAFATGRHYD